MPAKSPAVPADLLTDIMTVKVAVVTTPAEKRVAEVAANPTYIRAESRDRYVEKDSAGHRSRPHSRTMTPWRISKFQIRDGSIKEHLQRFSPARRW